MKNPQFFAVLQSSFAPWTSALRTRIRHGLTEHPNRIFSLMVFLLLSSSLLCFFLRKAVLPTEKTAGLTNVTVIGGMGEISHAAGNLAATLEMQAELNGLLSKKVLSAQDSLHIGQMMNRIKKLQTNITHHEKNQP
jgi:hypothetical protein